MRFMLPLAAGVLSLSGYLYARQDAPKTVLKTVHVAGNIHMLEDDGGFAGGNVGVFVGDEGVLVIDDKMTPFAPQVLDAIKKLSDKPVRFLLNTHFHGDHTGGNAFFGDRHATIVAHDGVRARLEKGAGNAPPAAREALPVITFNDRATIHVNGEDVLAMHIPSAHTDTDSVIWFPKSNVLHAGDLFFHNRFPFIDISSGGSVHGYIAGIEAVLKEVPADAKVIPGHGSLATVADFRADLEMIRACVDLVSGALKAGKTVEQMKQEKLLDKYKSFAWDFISADKFIDALAADLGKK